MKRALCFNICLMLCLALLSGCAKVKETNIDLSGSGLAAGGGDENAGSQDGHAEEEGSPEDDGAGSDDGASAEKESGEGISGDYGYRYVGMDATITSYTGSMTELEIPAQLEGYQIVAIGEEAFAYNEGLKKVVIPEGVDWVETLAFAYCHSLAEVVLPDGIRRVDPEAFADTPWWNAFLDTASGEWVTLGDGALYIYMGNETELHIDKEKQNFSLRSDTVKKLVFEEGVTEISPYTSMGCFNLKEVVFPSTLRIIGEGAIKGSGITELRFNEGLESIGFHAFAYSDGLRMVYLPESVTDMGEAIFEGCEELVFICPEGSVAWQYAVEHEYSRAEHE